MTITLKRKFELFARNDYAFYLEYVHRGHYVHARHTMLMADKLQKVETGEIKRLMIFLPPRHSKSNSCSETFPSWFIGRDPRRKVMLISYGDSLARTFGRKNRQKMEEFGQDIFGLSVAKDNASTNHWGIQGYPGGMLSQGVEASLTGHGANLVIIDDPIRNREVAMSKTQRDKIYEEYKSSIMTRLTSDARVVLIQTRWHNDDLAGAILANDAPGTWDVISLPGLAGDDDILGRNPGEPLWPENGFTKEWLENTRASIGSVAFQSLYQQSPTFEEGNIVKREWLKFYDTPPAGFDEVVISLDAAFKGNDDSDYCAFTVWGRIGADKYLLDIVRERLNFPQTVAALRQIVAKYPQAAAKLIEDKANGSAIIDYLKREISGMVAITPHESKIARLFAVSPQFEAGNVYLPTERRLPLVFDYIVELTSFPNGKNDDMCDSTSQALNYLESRTPFFFGRA
jgi:predicted phage terminase large subunit-like protein